MAWRRYPKTVARKQLETKLQNERNDKEAFLQQAQIERELTAVDVNTVGAGMGRGRGRGRGFSFQGLRFKAGASVVSR
jgi:hypothetical protein